MVTFQNVGWLQVMDRKQLNGWFLVSSWHVTLHLHPCLPTVAWMLRELRKVQFFNSFTAELLAWKGPAKLDVYGQVHGFFLLMVVSEK